VILLLGFWQDWGTVEPYWRRVGGHYVTCAGVCSDSLMIMFSDPDYDQQVIDYPPDEKWHNNAALVSHDIYSVAPESPSPGGFWWIPFYPEEVGFRHPFENCPDHLQPYEDYPEMGIPIHTEIEGAVFISPILAPPAQVDDLEIYYALGTAAAGSEDIRLIWSKVITDALGNLMPADYYIIYRDTESDFTPGPAKEYGNTTDTTYLDVNVAGDSSVNYYYYVNARKGLSWESANSRCVGEFDKDLINVKKKGMQRSPEIKRR
jgi:hypothetical protein